MPQTVCARQDDDIDITHLTLEELMEIDVYSASRRLERVQDTPDAVYVLTGEDIRRSRVNNIPDALRLVPGVQVARIDANKWGVSIRGVITGFAGTASARTTNQLLVLVDGRSVYDPLFGGVFWETQDLVLEDIDRIEVIRGPGGALWGANAVNGVINIITKHSRDTQGSLVVAGVGTEERNFATVRRGWQLGDDQHMRVYAKTLERGPGYSPSDNAYDKIQMYRTGFRWDRQLNMRDGLRLSGDWFGADVGQRDAANALQPTFTQDVDQRGGNLLGRWERKLSNTESLSAQVYYDYFEYDALGIGEKRNTYDFDFQHGFMPAERHQLVWGVGYRNTRDDIRSVNNVVDPARRSDATQSAFVQDTVALVPKTLHLTLGTKFEHNEYSRNEWQPKLRLGWTPDERQVWWTSVGKAARVPTRLDADIVLGDIRIGENVGAEKVTTYELGHRRLISDRLWLDVAAFYNEYRDLVTIESGPLFGNRMFGHTYGIEVASRWQATPAWRIDATYTYLNTDFEVQESSSARAQPAASEGSSPHYQYSIRSALDVSRQLQFDAIVRVVDDLPALAVPAYTALDLGISWWPRHDVELSLVGRDLLDSHHPEQQVVANGSGTEVQRGYYFKLSWRF